MDRRADVSLRRYASQDFDLLCALLGDAEMTRFVGGPESVERLEARHLRYLSADPESNGLFTILAGESSAAAGWVGYWETKWEGETVWECGWHVLPAFQGAGVATTGALLMLDHLWARGRHSHVHAFPSIDNTGSNALCARLGFEMIGEVVVEYPKGSKMRSQDWRLDLRVSTGR